MYPPLCLPLMSDSISVKPESCKREDAKKPCLRIPDSLCSPHICMGTIAPNYPCTTMSAWQNTDGSYKRQNCIPATLGEITYIAMDNITKVHHCTVSAEPPHSFNMLLEGLPITVIIIVIKVLVIHILKSHFFLLSCLFLQIDKVEHVKAIIIAYIKHEIVPNNYNS